ncbi:MAG TPA: methyltransferase domain-containing protein [Sedimenticola sp.]|nr:methyltransferase domain-containing protein [Sedimenticola sp.]
MLLGALFTPRASPVALLGMGAGGLVAPLLQALPACQLDAVELRPRVVAIARAWFALPDSSRLRVWVGDAGHYLAGVDRPLALLLVDLYLGEGMVEQQASRAFLADCRRVLRPGGLLILNYWSGDPRAAHALNRVLDEQFPDAVVTLQIPDGNCIAFAFAGGFPRLERRAFYTAAAALGERLGYPVPADARLFWRQSGGVFRRGRRQAAV